MPKTTSTQRAARTRRIKQQMADIVAQARHDAFNAAFSMAAKENPEGLSGAAIRWFNEAWTEALRPGSK